MNLLNYYTYGPHPKIQILLSLLGRVTDKDLSKVRSPWNMTYLFFMKDLKTEYLQFQAALMWKSLHIRTISESWLKTTIDHLCGKPEQSAHHLSVSSVRIRNYIEPRISRKLDTPSMCRIYLFMYLFVIWCTTQVFERHHSSGWDVEYPTRK